MKKRLSLIIPTYNSEKSIEKTMNAIINQTVFDDIEVIVIDDGSVDSTVEIVSDFICKHSNINMIKNTHNGVSASRNMGIANTSAKYIGFCDADDIPERTMYEKLLKIIETGKYDMVGCNFFSERTNSVIGCINDVDLKNREEILRFVHSYLGKEKKCDKVIWGSVYLNLYKKDIINKYNISFDERIEFAEDLLFTFEYLMACNKVYMSAECLYRYCCNFNSLMMSHHYKYINNMLYRRMIVIEKLERLCQENGVKDYEKRLDYTIRNYTRECIGNVFHNTEHGREEMIKEIIGIVNNPVVKESFFRFHYNSQNIDFKSAVLFWLIKMKLVNIIYWYFKIRLRRKF